MSIERSTELPPKDQVAEHSLAHAVSKAMTWDEEVRKKIERVQGELTEVENQIHRCVVECDTKIIPDGRPTSLDRGAKELISHESATDMLQKESETIKACSVYVKDYSKRLTRFNDMKDAALHLLTMIAEREGKPLKTVMEERGVVDE